MPIAKPCDAPAPADNKNHVTWECPKCNWRKVQGVTCEQCRAWMVNVTAPADSASSKCTKCGHDFKAIVSGGYDCRVRPYSDIGDPTICGCDDDFHASSVSEDGTELVLLRSAMLRIVEVAQAGAKCVDANSDAAERFRWIADRAAARSAEKE